MKVSLVANALYGQNGKMIVSVSGIILPIFLVRALLVRISEIENVRKLVASNLFRTVQQKIKITAQDHPNKYYPVTVYFNNDFI